MKKLFASVFVVTAIVTAAIGATGAMFSDKETSQDNIFRAGSIDLKIDNTSYYNGIASPLTTWTLANLDDGQGPSGNGAYLFFNFPDLKPGDKGEDTISLHVNDNKSWACMTINLTKNDDNTCNEPELLDDPTCTDPNAPGNTDSLDGELAQNVNFVWWGDDGDNVLEEGENVFKEGSASGIFNGESWTIADSTGNLWDESPNPLDPEKTYYIGKAWCFGNLTPAPLDPNEEHTPLTSNGGFLCDGSLVNNAAQTDIMTADVSFEAIQSRNNSNFVCGKIPDCVEIFASSSSNNNQGKRKDGSNVLADRSDPTKMFGAPQSTGAAFDAVVPNSFFSLGFTNGNIVLGFSSPFFNQPGPDLQVYEVTGGPPYPDEKVKVEVSNSSAGPWTLVAGSLTKDGTIDINPVPSAQFVRLTDVSNIADFEPTADAYDVDALKALCGRPTSTPTPTPGLCVKKPDVMLVLDRSGSISAAELTTLKNASNGFITALNLSTNTAHSGQSSFATLGSLDLQLTDNPVLAHNAVNALSTGGFTNLFQGLSLADNELASVRDRADGTSPDFAVVITDGEPNEPGSDANAHVLASAEADDLRSHGVTVYVVGVGVTPANETYLKTEIADDAAHYFPAANFAALQTILTGIANCPQ